MSSLIRKFEFSANALALFLHIGLLCLLFTFWQPSAARSSIPEAVILQIDGAIGPAVSDYVQEGIATASERKAQTVVIQMDTPGGLDLAMRDIVQAILNSPVPVITYVYPEGARAASAGTYILYSSHIAAMAPATNLGAATPVQIGGFPSSPDSKKDKKDKDESVAPLEGSAMQRKIIHDAAAYIRSLADRHGRNGEWAERAVREALSLTANEALEKGVIDVVASDLDDLFKQVDGREVVMSYGKETLSTRELTLFFIQPTWQNKLLAIISDPNIAYMLLLIGIYGLIYELANPGVFFPGVVGTISILLALYGFQVLPINYSGLALMILGIALMTAEAFVPSFGSLGIGGIIAFAAGSLILFDEESLRISPTLIIGTTAVSASFIIWLMGRLILFRKRQIRTGSEALIGMTGEVIDSFTGEGRILILGESWQARCTDHLQKGEKVLVTDIDGLMLTVQKFKEDM